MTGIAKYFIIILLFLFSEGTAQSDISNLSSKYHSLRVRLREQFVVVGDCHGCGLPASRFEINPFPEPNVVFYDDETLRQLGWYIAVLAVENHLLRINGHSTYENSMELYYALQAIERLDKYAEYL